MITGCSALGGDSSPNALWLAISGAPAMIVASVPLMRLARFLCLLAPGALSLGCSAEPGAPETGAHPAPSRDPRNPIQARPHAARPRAPPGPARARRREHTPATGSGSCAAQAIPAWWSGPAPGSSGATPTTVSARPPAGQGGVFRPLSLPRPPQRFRCFYPQRVRQVSTDEGRPLRASGGRA